MDRLAVLGIAIIGVLGIAYFAEGQVGASSTCLNSKCSVSVSSSWSSIAIALTLAGFVALYPRNRDVVEPLGVVSVWRRISAFFIDIIVVLSILSPALELPLLISEAAATGHFQWAFERDYDRPSDAGVISLSIFGAYLVIFLYFYMHLKANRPTLGQYISGYRIVAKASTRPTPAMRVITSWIGLCLWPISLALALNREDKAFWWDNVAGTKAVRVKDNCTGTEVR